MVWTTKLQYSVFGPIIFLTYDKTHVVILSTLLELLTMPNLHNYNLIKNYNYLLSLLTNVHCIPAQGYNGQAKGMLWTQGKTFS